MILQKSIIIPISFSADRFCNRDNMNLFLYTQVKLKIIFAIDNSTDMPI